ncbi:uncharacterized protein LOC131240114 isoform X2 [Magnolia sinica]|uniref:uncharacterized protein LOC131240114 isoform X2 n=1 Tax=Magnolia sinica TaxID=86752 RepID=UPI00265A3E0E|nr:uncharacterized protein LOC131240114 isoform X2 [Magnolia sinica]
MQKSRSNLLFDAWFPILYHLILLQFPAKISGIRMDVSLRGKQLCRTTVQGRYLISDDNGHVCDALSLDSWSRCCPETGEQFSCQGCNLVAQCCNSYEFCVSCCLNPAQLLFQTQKELALKVKIAKPVTAGTYASIFDFCAGSCRHNSASVVHENAYVSDLHHCFSPTSNSSGAAVTRSEARLAGINIVTGRQGESCNTACKSKGQSCVPSKLLLLNTCELLQKYMSCKGDCLASMGMDQPAEVVDDAPKHLNPGACLYTRMSTMLSCDGTHQHTRRLCPCA